MHDKGPSVRQKKVASVLQSLISRYYIEHAKDFGIKSMVLVDDIFVSVDLKNAQVWLSFSPEPPKGPRVWFERLVENQRDLESYLFKNMEIRRLPRLTLQLSDPEKTFKLLDIFDTLERHEDGSSTDSKNPKEQ